MVSDEPALSRLLRRRRAEAGLTQEALELLSALEAAHGGGRERTAEETRDVLMRGDE